MAVIQTCTNTVYCMYIRHRDHGKDIGCNTRVPFDVVSFPIPRIAMNRHVRLPYHQMSALAALSPPKDCLLTTTDPWARLRYRPLLMMKQKIKCTLHGFLSRCSRLPCCSWVYLHPAVMSLNIAMGAFPSVTLTGRTVDFVSPLQAFVSSVGLSPNNESALKREPLSDSVPDLFLGGRCADTPSLSSSISS